MSAQLAYSIHLGSDKNRTTKAKGIAKSNPTMLECFLQQSTPMQISTPQKKDENIKESTPKLLFVAHISLAFKQAFSLKDSKTEKNIV